MLKLICTNLTAERPAALRFDQQALFSALCCSQIGVKAAGCVQWSLSDGVNFLTTTKTVDILPLGAYDIKNNQTNGFCVKI